jgi:D-methionine transport system ATP-binding protein
MGNRTVVMIRIMGLYKRFDALTVLEDVNLDIERGEIFGVIGKSGAGKSTLVRCINYLERPTSGDILFDGARMGGLAPRELYQMRKSMGMVFQQFNLMMQRTALDNVRFPMGIAGIGKTEARRRAAELLEMVGLPDKADAFPAQLSGGQRQRVAIARAMALNPKALLCDEATSALDPETTRGILALIKTINEEFGITIVVITHEMQVVESVCKRVAVLDNARVAESGAVGEVFSKPRTQAARGLLNSEAGTEGTSVGGRRCRIVFDGDANSEPLISDLALRFRKRVNILSADLRGVNGAAYGQMLLQLPENDEIADRMTEYLRAKGLKVEENRDDG